MSTTRITDPISHHCFGARTSRPVPRSADRTPRLCAVFAILLVVAACRPDDRPYGKLHLPNPADVREDSLARVRWAETSRYRYLRRAERTATDKPKALASSWCEAQHISKEYGRVEGDRALNEAIVAINQTASDRIAAAQLDRALSGSRIRAFSEAECDSVRATWPPLDAASDPYPIPAVAHPR